MGGYHGGRNGEGRRHQGEARQAWGRQDREDQGRWVAPGAAGAQMVMAVTPGDPLPQTPHISSSRAHHRLSQGGR